MRIKRENLEDSMGIIYDTIELVENWVEGERVI